MKNFIILLFMVFYGNIAFPQTQKQLPETKKIESDMIDIRIVPSKMKYQVMNPIILEVTIVNKSNEIIILSKSPLINGIDLSITREFIDHIGYLEKGDDGKKRWKGKGEIRSQEVPMTVYGKRESERRNNPGKYQFFDFGILSIPSGQKFQNNVELSRLFDFSVTGEYVISSKLKFQLGSKQDINKNEWKTLKLEDIRIKITHPNL